MNVPRPPETTGDSWVAPRQFHESIATRYTLDGVIGRGGMGVVYRARDIRHHRAVAIKVLNPDLVAGAGAHRFVEEIRTLAHLQHPRIVSLIDSGEAVGIPYYVMPCVEGLSVRERLAREGPFSIKRAVSIASQVAEALDHAHAHGVIHRDIKPANIIVGENDQAVVLDFGLALAIDREYGERLSITGMILGTAHYMSPEQAGGNRIIDRRTDIYSLGCVVYEMLAGEPPFTGATHEAIRAKQMIAPVPRLSIVRAASSTRLQGVLETALAKVPADRFDSAGAFARALAGSVSNSPRLAQRHLLAGLGVAAAIGVSVPLFREGGAFSFADLIGPATPRAVPSLAVLYLEDLSPDSSLGNVAIGLTEHLIQELGGVNLFRVVPRNGVKPYRNRSMPLDSVASSLGVQTLLDGALEEVGERLRVRIHVFDVASNTLVDSVLIEGRPTNLQDLNRETAERATVVLRKQLGREARRRRLVTGTRSGIAKELVLKAQQIRSDAVILAAQPHLADLHAAIEALGRADSLLSLAEHEDNDWLRPILERGWTAYEKARLHGEGRIEAARAAMGYADRVLAQSPGNAEALELRGTARWWLATQLEVAPLDSSRIRAAEADLRVALATDSSRATGWASLSYLLLVKGSFAEARLAAIRALQADPFLDDAATVFSELFYSSLMLSDFTEARDWCRRGRLSTYQDPRFLQCELTLLRHDISKVADTARAWEVVAELERIYPAEKAIAAGRPYDAIYRRVVAGTLSGRAGRHDIARAELARAKRATAGDSSLRLDLAYDEASVLVVLDEREKAIDILQALLKARPFLRPFIERDPLFKELGTDWLTY